MTAPLLRAEGMTAGYGKMAILHDVTLEVRPGEMVSVIGPNGAGKSTAFKTIVGFLRPTSGRVVFDGQDIAGLRPDQVLVRGLAYVPQGRIVFPQMTVLENLEMGAYIERDGARIRSARPLCALFPPRERRIRRPQRSGGSSRGGHRPRAMTTPKLIADEPRSARAQVRTLIFDKLTEMTRGVHVWGGAEAAGAGVADGGTSRAGRNDSRERRGVARRSEVRACTRR